MQLARRIIEYLNERARLQMNNEKENYGDLAVRAGLTEETVSRWRKRKRTLKLENLIPLMLAFGKQYNEIVNLSAEELYLLTRSAK